MNTEKVLKHIVKNYFRFYGFGYAFVSQFSYISENLTSVWMNHNVNGIVIKFQTVTKMFIYELNKFTYILGVLIFKILNLQKVVIRYRHPTSRSDEPS